MLIPYWGELNVRLNKSLFLKEKRLVTCLKKFSSNSDTKKRSTEATQMHARTPT